MITIHNGRLCYEIIIEEGKKKHFTFNGSQFADYLEEHFKSLGYTVKRTGNGEKDYNEYFNEN